MLKIEQAILQAWAGKEKTTVSLHDDRKRLRSNAVMKAMSLIFVAVSSGCLGRVLVVFRGGRH